jgi:hypothetical protein
MDAADGSTTGFWYHSLPGGIGPSPHRDDDKKGRERTRSWAHHHHHHTVQFSQTNEMATTTKFDLTDLSRSLNEVSGPTRSDVGLGLGFPRSDDPEVVVFDLETTRGATLEDMHVLQFGCTVLHPVTMAVKSEVNFMGMNGGGGTSFRDRAEAIRDALDGRTWVGHNIVSFDIPILVSEFRRAGIAPPVPTRVVDTLAVFRAWASRSAGASVFGSMKLEDLMHTMGLGQQTHRAIDDAHATRFVAVALCAGVLLGRLGTPPAPGQFTAAEVGDYERRRAVRASSSPPPPLSSTTAHSSEGFAHTAQRQIRPFTIEQPPLQSPGTPPPKRDAAPVTPSKEFVDGTDRSSPLTHAASTSPPATGGVTWTPIDEAWVLTRQKAADRFRTVSKTGQVIDPPVPQEATVLRSRITAMLELAVGLNSARVRARADGRLPRGHLVHALYAVPSGGTVMEILLLPARFGGRASELVQGRNLFHKPDEERSYTIGQIQWARAVVFE